MDKFFDLIIKLRKSILILFIIFALISIICVKFVDVNYNINEYLPDNAISTISMDLMEQEFEGGIPNLRIMLKQVSITEVLEYKEKLLKIEGVESVTWLDDVINILEPLEFQDQDTVSKYYVNNNALLTASIDEDNCIEIINQIRNLIGEGNPITGIAANTALSLTSTDEEIPKIAILVVTFVLLILILTTTSWVEPIIILLGLLISVILNAGTNLIFGEISFVTNAAANILQLSVSLDYSVFLIHRFEELKEGRTKEEAMKQALIKSTKSILSSGLTTVIGFLALTQMAFKIGPDLGIVLAKGITFSIITVFIFMPALILLTTPIMEKTKHRNFLPSFKPFGKLVSKSMFVITIIFIIVIIPSYLSSINNSYYYGNSNIFGEDSSIWKETNEIKNIFGKNDTYVVMLPSGSPAKEVMLIDEYKKLDSVISIIAYAEQVGTTIPYEFIDTSLLKQLQSDKYSRIVLSVEQDYEGDETFSFIEEIHRITNEIYPNSYFIAGEGISTYDLMNTITKDMTKVNLITILSVFIVLVITLKSVLLPAILVITIETAIWINLSIPYYTDQSLFFIAYLIISSVQLGATVDYGILFTERFLENRQKLARKESIIQTITDVTSSILTSGLALTIVGFAMGIIASHRLLSQLGYLLGQGTLLSMFSVLFVLPCLLYITDKIKKVKEGSL